MYLDLYFNELLDPTRPKQDTTFFVTKDNQVYICHHFGIYNCRLECYVYNVNCPSQLKHLNLSNIRTAFTLCSVQYSNYTTQLLNTLNVECQRYLYEAIYTYYLHIDHSAMIDLCNDYTDLFDQVEDAITDIINKSDDIVYQDFCRHFYSYYFDMQKRFNCYPNVEWYEKKCAAKA